MTKREAAVLEIYTGTVMLEEDDRKYTQQYIEKLLGRSFSYVEFLNENFTAELKERAKPDFLEICRNAYSIVIDC